MECLDDNAVLALVARSGGGPLSAEVEAHLDSCGGCRKLVSFAVAALSGAQPSAAPSTDPRGDEAPGDLRVADTGRYELRGQLARGGMGVVYDAWDQRHDRRVAIKLLLHGDEAAERRFLRESRIGARLQHPGIVPVYEAGRWSDGQPFIAMKLVEGRTLHDALALSPAERRLSLLPHLIAAADAVAYAHAQGIVHRDLKPANVLLGQYGETVVIDWGLARFDADPASADDASAQASSGDDAALTRPGAAVGTPAYMPPEQARGPDVTARADVYALGAILYHLLAGAPPYEAKSAREALLALHTGPPPPLAERAPDAPPELAAVAERAMARDPAARYPTARELADDLRRFSEGRLVEAHRYSAAQLARRWFLRHRAEVAVAGAALVLLAALGALSVRRIARERRVALAQRDAAEGLSQFMLVDLRKKLAALGKLELLSGAGEKIEAYYRTLSQLDDSDSVDALAHRASALELLSYVDDVRNDHAAARDHVARALELREKVAARAPGDAEAQAALVETLRALGGEHHELGKTEAFAEAARRAASLAQALAARDPSSKRAQVLVAQPQRDLAELAYHGGNASGALPARVVVRDALLQAAAAAPGDDDVQWQLGEAYLYLGQLQTELSKLDDALASETRALAVYDKLIAKEPDNVRWLVARSNALQITGVVQSQLGLMSEALATLRACNEQREALARRDPNDENARRRLGYSLLGFVRATLIAGRPQEGAAAVARLLELAEATAAKSPESFTSQRDLAYALLGAAEQALASGEAARAAAQADRARAIVDALLRKDPSATYLAGSRGHMLICAARAQAALGRKSVALATARAALAQAEEVCAKAKDPINLRFRVEARALVAELAPAAEARATARSIFAALDELLAASVDEWRRAGLQSAAVAARALAASDRAAALAGLQGALRAAEPLRAAGKLQPPEIAALEAARSTLRGLDAGPRRSRDP